MDLGIKRKVALALGGSQGLQLSAAAPMSEAAATMVLSGKVANNGSSSVLFCLETSILFGVMHIYLFLE
ncbi:MAG: hypothetical protein VYB45_13055 [Pseudomonadota bacterium]|nr:hypothetical protein [Pseudomonadota bacterium]